MKHIRIFETVSDFEAAKASLVKPNVGLITETGKSYAISGGSEPEVDYSKVAMFFENVDTQDVTIGVKQNNASAYKATLETSTDGDTWETWGDTSTTALSKTIGAGERLYIRNAKDVGYFNYLNRGATVYNHFTSTSKVNVGGNIMSLGYKNFEDKTSITQTYCYYYVFYNMTNLVDASKLVLPPTQLTYGCYKNMFCGCTSLTKAPELPATILDSYCYYSMFKDCTSLTKAPELPQVKTLYANCCEGMFENCSNLNYIKAMFILIPNNSCTANWVSGVSSTGTFVKNAAATWITGVNGIPEGWTVETATE